MDIELMLFRLHNIYSILARKRAEEVEKSQKLSRQLREATWQSFCINPRRHLLSVLNIAPHLYLWTGPGAGRPVGEEWILMRERYNSLLRKKADVDRGIQCLHDQLLGIGEIINAGSSGATNAD